jgi:MFS family permease
MQKGRVDWMGALLATSSLILLVYAIVSAESAGWASVQTIGMLTLAALLFVVFIQTQKNRQDALVALHIFKAPNLASGNIAMALMAAAWIPLWFFLNLYLQQILQLNAFYSGLALLPMTFTIMIVMVGLTGKLITRFGIKKNLVAGLASLTLSLLLFSTVPPDGNFWIHVLPASLLGALGMSLAYIPGTMAAMSGAKQEETGLASGIVNTGYQIGSALGLAAITVLAGSTTAAAVSTGAAEANALNQGFQSAFMAAAGLSSAGLFIAALKIKIPKA